MFKKLLFFALMASPLVWTSCFSSLDSFNDDLANSDPELVGFLEEFEAEAASRGATLPALEEFHMTFVSDLGDFCGFGWWNYDGRGTRRVEIENTERCWLGYDEDQKEQLMYHEFGHALLSRPHIDTTLPNGQPLSMMCGECDQTRIYYHPRMKDYYLDELFDRNTPLPDWVTNENFIRSAYEEDFESETNEWESIILGDEDNQSGWDANVDQDENNNRALRVTTPSNPIAESELLVLDRFDISDFPDCASLKASITLKYNLPLNAQLTMGLSLRERNGEDLTRFAINRQDFRASSSLEEQTLTTEIYCLPEKTDVVTVSVRIETLDQVDLLIDDVSVELWN